MSHSLIKAGSLWRFVAPTTTPYYTSGSVYVCRSEPDIHGMFRMDDNKNKGDAAAHYWDAARLMQDFVFVDGDAYYGISAGMTLRDYFAGQALAALMQDDELRIAARDKGMDTEVARAKIAYLQADAMIAERDK